LQRLGGDREGPLRQPFQGAQKQAVQRQCPLRAAHHQEGASLRIEAEPAPGGPPLTPEYPGTDRVAADQHAPGLEVLCCGLPLQLDAIDDGGEGAGHAARAGVRLEQHRGQSHGAGDRDGGCAAVAAKPDHNIRAELADQLNGSFTCAECSPEETQLVGRPLPARRRHRDDLILLDGPVAVELGAAARRHEQATCIREQLLQRLRRGRSRHQVSACAAAGEHDSELLPCL